MKAFSLVRRFALALLGGMLCSSPGLHAARNGGEAPLVLEQAVNGVWQAHTGMVAWGYNFDGQTNVPAGLSSVVAIAAGGRHAVALKSDGRVVAWGNNDKGQINVPAGLSSIVAIAAGDAHTVALKSDGTVVAWGSNYVGETVVPSGLSGVVAIAAGDEHTVALKGDGTVVAWGWNNSGQSDVPKGLSGVVAIAAGNSHTVALKSDGTVVAWGYNYSGQTNVPAGLSGVVAIAAGNYHTVALKGDGTVVAWGWNLYGQATVPAGLHGVVAITVGGVNTVALKDDGSVVAWGYNHFGQTDLPAGLGDVAAVAAGFYYAVALTSIVDMENSVVGGSTQTTLRLTNPSAITPLAGLRLELPASTEGQFKLATPLPATLAPGESVQITLSYSPRTTADASGRLQVFAEGSTLPLVETALHVRSAKASLVDGLGMPVTAESSSRVVAWGDNYRGQTGVPSNLSGVEAISAGYFHNAALRSDGTVVVWGDNFIGQLNVPAGLADVIAVAAGAEHTIALKSNGRVLAWGGNQEYQTNVPANLSGVVAITAGFYHSAALTSEGKVVVWGDTRARQATAPVGLSGVTALAAGASHTVALKSDGKVVAWGFNFYGETRVPADLGGVAVIAAGAYHTVVLKRDGSIVAWGNNERGQTDVPADLGEVVDIKAGYYHTVALKRDGTVTAWGLNLSGQTSVPAGLSNVAAISAGAFHTVALIEAANVFPTVPLSQHRDHTLFIKDTDAFPLKQISAVIEGPDADQFSVLAVVPSTIAAGDQVPFTLRFAPTRAGRLNATLKIYSNDPGSPLILPLKGSGNFELAATKAGVASRPFTYAPLRLDRQTGLILQTIRFTNTTGSMLSGLRLTLSKVNSDISVYSSSAGKMPGTLEVHYTNAIKPGEAISFDLVYSDPKRRTADSINPTITAQALEETEPVPGPVAGTILPLRQVRDTPQGPLLNWTSRAGTLNVVEYSNDGGKTWFSAVHLLRGAANMFWVDRGQPETMSRPVSKNARMYRVKRL